jgi:hypothetical protein
MTALYIESNETQNKLLSMGLTEELLLNVVRSGVLARRDCTANHPPIYAGISAWANAVRTLREQLLPKSWTRTDEGNYSLVIHPNGSIAIALATGDENTGSHAATPMTKSPKGPSTRSAIAVNLSQMSLFQEYEDLGSGIDSSNTESRFTWLFLMARVGNKVKSELSLPISCVGKVNAWEERIILSDIDLDPNTDIFATPIVPQMPDIEIDIRRKSA